MKRTKIICTIGPASESEEVLQAMMLAGMNSARLNMSHGTHAEHEAKINSIKKIRNHMKLPIPIIIDTKGPEIRIGKISGGSALLKEDENFRICIEDIEGDSKKCSVNYKGIIDDVKSGDRILIDDGLIELEVVGVSPDSVDCIIKNEGEIKDNKGINIPGAHVSLPSITDRDKKDILFGIKNGVEFIAESFVRKAEDIQELRKFLDNNGGEDIGIIAKIENRQGVDNIDNIISLSDGIMVARGDLGVEIPPEEVPLIQKEIISKSNLKGKFVITATQMMDSMIRNPRPTRAEVADVANAILDGSDVIMLSGETASGTYPLESVSMMSAVSLAAEKGIDHKDIVRKHSLKTEINVTNSIALATCTSAENLNADAIITPTVSGYTARVVSKLRPTAPILAFTQNEKVFHRMALSWGVNPFLMGFIEEENEFFDAAIKKAQIEGYIKTGDTIILTAGVPLGIGGTTNMMRINTVHN